MVKKMTKAAAAPKRPAVASHLTDNKISVAAALTTSAFSPPALRQALFASTVLGLDAYRIRIHDTNTGKLKCEAVLEKGVSINALAWGVLPVKDKKSIKKKRKRLSNGSKDAAEDGEGDVVVLAATNRGSVLVFSPAEAAITGVLEGEHIGEVKHVVFSNKDGGRAWSCGVDGKLVEWDVARRVSMRSLMLPEKDIQRLAPLDNDVLCASSTIYSIDKEMPSRSDQATFTANTTLINALITSVEGDRFITAAETDRFINIFSLTENKQIGSLVAESDIHTISVFKALEDEEVLAAVTTDGIVEVFKSPFTVATTAKSPAASRKKKSATRKSDAKVKIVRPSGKTAVTITDVSVHEQELVVAWVEGAINVEFEKIRWASAEDGSFMLSGLVEITREKSSGLAAHGATTNGVKDVSKMTVDQAHTVVVAGDDMQDVGMEDADKPASASEAEDEEEEESDEGGKDTDASDAEPEEPTFADRFQALEVSAAPAGTGTALTAPTKSRALQTPSAGALTSVLTQALKTNDTQLLESCLNSSGSSTIRNTIRKLPSPLAVILLERLAERLARRPGRSGPLGEWVRWTLVAHGGYLVTLPNLMRTLAGLHSTLNTRAASLPRLLALQGRLDMLQSQVELRNEIKSAAVRADEDVLYIEGETRDSDSDEDEDLEEVRIEDASYIRSAPGSDGESADEEGDGDDIVGSSDEGDDDEEDEDDSEVDDAGGLLDLEASEASDDDEDDEEDDRF